MPRSAAPATCAIRSVEAGLPDATAGPDEAGQSDTAGAMAGTQERPSTGEVGGRSVPAEPDPASYSPLSSPVLSAKRTNCERWFNSSFCMIRER